MPVFSRIANFDDLDPLRAEPEVSVVMVRSGEALPGDADLILLPGSKATLADLAFVRDQGWDIDIAAHVRRGGAVLGICGGYQMLGPSLADPDGIEGPAAVAAGLGLLDVDTVLTSNKRLVEVSGRETHTGAAVAGYEMHGRHRWPGGSSSDARFVRAGRRCRLPDGQVMGCYVHGLFSSDAFRTAFLQRLRPGARVALNYEASVDDTLDVLADHLEAHLEIDGMIND